MVAARGHARATSCFTPLPRRVWTTPRTPPGTVAHSLVPILSSALSPSHPNGATAADERRRGHSHCLASSLRPEAPPRPPLPLHQPMPRRTPCIAAHAVFPISGRPRSPSLIRRHQAIPEPTSLLCEFTVSTGIFPLSPLPRLHRVAIKSAGAASLPPPAMSPPPR